MTGVKTVGSARGTSSGDPPLHEELVWLIANEMKPWKHPKRQVLATVRRAIDALRRLLAVKTFSNKERQHAEKLLLAINKIDELIFAAPPMFFSSAVERANAVQATSGLFYQCLYLIRQRAPKRGWKKGITAICALSLIEECSTKKPAAGNRDTTFCMIASWLFEVVTGEPEPNLEYDCKRQLRLDRRVLPDRRGKLRIKVSAHSE
jgi:hypothetical protein